MGHKLYRSPVAHLIFTSHSLIQNVIECPEWNVTYELHKTDDTVRVVRHDAYLQQPFVVAEWERHTFHTDKLRFMTPNGYDSGLLPVDTIFPKTSSFFSYSDRRTFVSVDPPGRRFTWKWSTTSNKLYHEEERDASDEALPVADFNGNVISLFENCFPYLDTLLVTGLITEAKRRDEKAAVHAGILAADLSADAARTGA